MSEEFNERLQPAEEDEDTAGLEDAPAGTKGESRIPALPEDALVLIPVRNAVLFPEIVFPLTLGRERSIAAAQEAARQERAVGVILQRDPEEEEPGPEDLHRTGTRAAILRYLTTPDGAHHVVSRGEQRFRVVEFLEGYPFLAARVVDIPEPEQTTTEIEARFTHLKQRAVEGLRLIPNAPDELTQAVEQSTRPAVLADLVSSYMDFKPSEKQEVLEAFDLQQRLDKVIELLNHRIEVLRLTREISQQTRESMESQQREYLLREQLKTIQRELGESDAKGAEAEELDKAVREAGMPTEAEEQARKELKRLERMPEASAEYPMLRTYLEWMVELPWKHTTEKPIDIAEARRILDEDHYGLDKVKRRILEFLAVRKLNPEGKSPILCFVGPPGVGKTSLGQSIARATGRQFVRASLGGLHDEAEIRGHRRTYIGALPGIIVQHIRKAGTRNPVFMLDEMDKLGVGFQGDPASALLEVLDPEQNSTFRDNYLGVTFDLSQVMFIGTANMLDTIPGPLRDRMEVIELTGYTEAEKVQIAQRYLVRRQLRTNGLTAEQCEITEQAIRHIIREYTREAGCRNLEREIGAVCRHVAMRVAEGDVERMRIDAADLHEALGPRRYESEVAMRTSVPGVATGLAWTPVGGDILFVEASRTPGKGRLTLTGQLGEVMKESAQAALTLLKARARELGVDPEAFDHTDVHIHVPAGAIPKDGPSAGVAMFLALVSLFTDQTVKHDTAVTGEISLRGLVLPVGGIKEKVSAALRAGIRTVLLPARNRKEFEEIPAEAREKLEFVWVEHVEDAMRAALGDAGIGVPRGEEQPGQPGFHAKGR